MPAFGRWYITQHAVERYMFVRRCVDFERAESELIALMPSATYRQTDSFGRQLWRSGRPLQLRWVLGFENPGKPQVIWVGQGRPPDAHWSPP